MKKYVVTGFVTVSAYTYVRASSAAKARQLASDRMPVLAPGTQQGENPWAEFVIEEADGEVKIEEVILDDGLPEDDEDDEDDDRSVGFGDDSGSESDPEGAFGIER